MQTPLDPCRAKVHAIKPSKRRARVTSNVQEAASCYTGYCSIAPRFFVRSSALLRLLPCLTEDTGDETSGDCAATLAHVEALALLENVGLVELADHLDVVTGHDELGGVLGALGPCEGARLVGGADEHLGPVVVAETGMAATLFLAEDVHGDEELPLGLDLAGDGDDHTATDVLALDTTEQETGVVTSTRLVARLLEGLDVGDLGLDGRGALADELDFLVPLQDTALDTARNDGTATGNGEDVLDGHEEGLLGVTGGGGDPGVDGLEELIDLGLADLGPLALERAQSGAHDDGCLVALEAVAGQQLAHLHLDELQHLGVLDGIDLVDENDNLLDTDLAGEQQVLTGLGHLAVRGGDDDDGAVHVGGTGDHVLDVIGVTGAVDVGIVAVVGLVLDVGRGDGDTTLALLGRLVDGAVLEELGVALLGLTLGDGGCEGGLEGVSVCPGRRCSGAKRRCTFPWSTWPMVPASVRILFTVCVCVRWRDAPMLTWGLSRAKAA
jgi:hypothetical protein